MHGKPSTPPTGKANHKKRTTKKSSLAKAIFGDIFVATFLPPKSAPSRYRLKARSGLVHIATLLTAYHHPLIIEKPLCNPTYGSAVANGQKANMQQATLKNSPKWLVLFIVSTYIRNETVQAGQECLTPELHHRSSVNPVVNDAAHTKGHNAQCADSQSHLRAARALEGRQWILVIADEHGLHDEQVIIQ